MNYPIAEVFDSIQGEGAHAGAAMTFIRFAGCTVGKPYTFEARKELSLPMYRERCVSWDGIGFACDTNYRKNSGMSFDALIDVAHSAERVCLTGGEPFMHELDALVYGLIAIGRKVHVETSGTILNESAWVRERLAWVTVSPKMGVHPVMLDYASEIKVLVGGASYDDVAMIKAFGQYRDKLWVQPINGEHVINEENLKIAVAIVHKYPQVRLSTQLHKIWRVR